MKIATRMLALFLLLLGALVLPGRASAQRVRTYDMNCSSDDEQRHHCSTNFPNINNVELLRQFSGSPCIQGQTWGFDARGIWVDRGCRAEFRVFVSGDEDRREGRDDRDRRDERGDRDDRGGMWRGGQSVVINCKSDDEQLHRCRVEGNIWNARVEVQHSGSPCTLGLSWGFDDDTIWVARGCRADFRVWVGGGGRGRSVVIRCKSDDERLNRCAVEGRIWNVQLEKQNSGSPCVRGESWGFDENTVWVDHGCRADFRVWAGGDFQGRSAVVRCGSDDERQNRCRVEGEILNAELERQISGSPCIEGRTWGFEGNAIWVDRGCRADFRVWMTR